MVIKKTPLPAGRFRRPEMGSGGQCESLITRGRNETARACAQPGGVGRLSCCGYAAALLLGILRAAVHCYSRPWLLNAGE